MNQASPSASNPSHSQKRKTSHFVVRNYRLRFFGTFLFALMFVGIDDFLKDPRVWVIAAAILAWPHLFFWLARRAPSGYIGEAKNIQGDGFMGGAMIAALAFRLWPSTVILALMVLNTFSYGGWRLMLRTGPLIAAGVLVGIAALGFRVHLDTEPLSIAVSVFTIIVYSGFIGSAIFRLYVIRDESKRALEAEKQKSHELLLKVFPDAVIPRLQSKESPIADEFADVTVLFSDIVGYTPLAERLGPRRTVMLLNDLYRRFDQAAAECGVEKVETVGDGYLAVAGAPARNDHHPEAVARFALAIIEAARQVPISSSEPVQIRMGIHTGPIFGGVIGEHRFHYGIFGETVNVASRVQSHSQPGRILVSESTYKRLQGNFQFAACDAIELKGHGPMRTYWLLGAGQVK
jgi:class 3 adenylate cyclase